MATRLPPEELLQREVRELTDLLRHDQRASPVSVARWPPRGYPRPWLSSPG